MSHDNNSRITKVGYVGLGVMGGAMAGNLLEAGYDLTVWNRTKSKCDDFEKAGAHVALTPRELSESGPEIIFMNLSRTCDVEQVLFDKDGLAEGFSEGQIVIDNSTINPIAAQRIAQRLKDQGVYFLDAPVSGGNLGAKDGTLSIMVGGDEDVFKKSMPVLNVLGKTVVYLGSAGMGQTCKACNQIAVACNLLGVCEAMAFAKKSGLDLKQMLDVVTGGAGNSVQLEKNGPKIISGDMSAGFRVDLILKDLNIIREAAGDIELKLAGVDLIANYFSTLSQDGHGDNGSQSLSIMLENLGGFRFHI